MQQEFQSGSMDHFIPSLSNSHAVHVHLTHIRK